MRCRDKGTTTELAQTLMWDLQTSPTESMEPEDDIIEEYESTLDTNDYSGASGYSMREEMIRTYGKNVVAKILRLNDEGLSTMQITQKVGYNYTLGDVEIILDNLYK